MAWMLLLLVLSGRHSVNCDDLIESELMELNHAVTCDGVCRFDQLILWKWSPDYRRWDAHYWAIVGMGGELAEYPVNVGKFHECRINREGRRIVIRSKLFRETWTVGDPERENLKLQPAEFRLIPYRYRSICVVR